MRVFRLGWIPALLGIGLIASALAVGMTYWEAQQRRRAVEALFVAEGEVLTAVLADAAWVSGRAYDELEGAVARRLEDILVALDTLSQRSPDQAQQLWLWLNRQDFLRVFALDRSGNIIAFGPRWGRSGGGMGRMMGPGPPWAQRGPESEPRPPLAPPSQPEARSPSLPPWLADPAIAQVLSGEEESIVLGLRQRRRGTEDVYGIVRRRTGGGAWVGYVDAEALGELQRSASREAMFQRVRGVPGVLDVSWKSLEATPNERPYRWEWVSRAGHPAFAGIRWFEDFDGTVAEIRVVLDASLAEALAQDAWRQGITRGALIVLATLAAAGLFFSRQNIRLLESEKERILHEVQRLEEEARRKEKLTAMGELAAGVAHEIRNPLNAIVMAAQRLRRESSPSPEGEDLLNIIQEEAARVEQVVEEFLRLARPPAIRPHDADLAQVVQETLDRFRPSAQTHGVTVEYQGPESLPYRLDRQQFVAVLENLLRNALEAQPEGGVIRVRLLANTEGVLLQVSDSGVGIPPELRERVFDLYFTTKPDGTGLGLPLVQRIVAAHGGTVSLESAVGQGTTVTVRLPRAQAEGRLADANK